MCFNSFMKIKYITEVEELKPMTVYKAHCLADIISRLGNKRIVHYSVLNNAMVVAYFSR